jgi:hypothetical protein
MNKRDMWIFTIIAMSLVMPFGVAPKHDLLTSGEPFFLTINHAQAASCNPPGTYEFYPGTGFYPSGSSESYPWQTPVGNAFEGFESYANSALIESSADKDRQSHLEVTSGALYSKYVGPSLYRRAKIDAYNFRMLIQGLSNELRVKWTDQAIESRFYVDVWQTTDHSWQGVHLFARYRTENDLYVATLRKNGFVYIKKKQCRPGEPPLYTELASGQFLDQNGNPRSFHLKQWYTLTFAAIGNHLEFFIDGVPQLSVTDGTFSWGTAGIRTDYATVYLDDIILFDDLSDF